MAQKEKATAVQVGSSNLKITLGDIEVVIRDYRPTSLQSVEGITGKDAAQEVKKRLLEADIETVGCEGSQQVIKEAIKLAIPDPEPEAQCPVK